MVLRRRLLLATFAAYLPAASLPAIAGQFGAGADPALVVVPFCAAFAVGFLMGGRLADRVEATRVVGGALALLALAGVAAAVAPSDGWLVAARAVEGLAAAGVPPATQRALTTASGDARAGRSLGAMMIAVAVATLGGPVLARAIGDWATAALVLAVLVPGIAAAAVLTGPRGVAIARPERGGIVATPGVRAGWLVSALVLAGYWTALTRLGTALDTLGAPAGMATAAPLLGALGIPLVVLAGRASDRHGPRAPMLVTTVAGAAGFALAAVAPSPGTYLMAAAGALAAYWAYLPVVSVQVQRSAHPATRGRAVGGLYASMWLGAAVAGALAAGAGSPQVVAAGASACWALAAVVVWRGFLAHPVEPRGAVPRTAAVPAGAT